MPQVLRFGCAGIAVIIIAALTSVGLYAIVAGGLTFGGAGARIPSGGAPVLVTIQAAQVTATVLVLPTSTPMPASLIAPAAARTPLTTAPPIAAAPVDVRSTPAPAAPAAQQQPLASPPASAPSAITQPAAPPGRTEPGKQIAHDGLTLELVEIERGWQSTAADGSPTRARPGFEAVTVHVRLKNEAGQTRYVADTDLMLVAEDGARFGVQQIPAPREPSLPTVPILPGDSVRGWLTFDVPAGTSTSRLQWSPTRPDRPRAEATYFLALPQ